MNKEDEFEHEQRNQPSKGLAGCLGCLGIIFIGFFGLIFILIIASLFSGEEKEQVEQTDKEINRSFQEEKVTDKSDVSDWREEIENISKQEISNTQKYEQASDLAQNYSPTEDEMVSFFNDMINDYQNQNYITKLDDEVYALENIFKSYVIHMNASSQLVSDIGFDYWQNVKYVYRGVDSIDSDAVKSNNYQIEKGLIKLQESANN